MLERSTGEHDVLRGRHRLPREQARARLRPADPAARRRPPRLRRADEGGVRGARRRPRPRSSCSILQFVHLVEGGERASMSKRRGDFVTLDELIDADRRRRRALLHAPALARHDGRPRPRPRARAVQREPRLLRAVRARADRVDAGARRGRSASPRRWRDAAPSAGRAATRPSARWSRSCSRSPTRSPRPAERRAPHRIAAYALELAQVFTAFYRDCQVVGAEPARRSRRFRLRAAASPRSARSRARSDLLGVTAPDEM